MNHKDTKSTKRLSGNLSQAAIAGETSHAITSESVLAMGLRPVGTMGFAANSQNEPPGSRGIQRRKMETTLHAQIGFVSSIFLGVLVV